MQYREFGSTGEKISTLGFGAMRLPEYEKDGEWYIDEDKAIPLIRYAYEKGINYFDTAQGYCHSNSQATLGKAIKPFRDKIMLSTKLGFWVIKKRGDYRRLLEQQLEILDTDYIDFHHLHALSEEKFHIALELNVIEEMEQAKAEGLIRHKAFSFHDKPEAMKEIIDCGAFESVLCQYNLLDRANERMIEYAHEKGLGTVIMGPVAGGRLALTSKVLRGMTTREIFGTPELAIRFVIANKNVSCALSGMNEISQIDQNAGIASNEETLSEQEWNNINRMLDEVKEMSDLYCTGCEYCLPCPKGIIIPKIFGFYNQHKMFGLTEHFIKQYKRLGVDADFGSKPDSCAACGACVKVCPQKINIPEKLAEITEEYERNGRLA